MIITIQELLKKCGFDDEAKTKLIRHTQKNITNLYDLYCSDKDKFFYYFQRQNKEKNAFQNVILL